ncbi:MAG: M28 family peptidase [Phycisphaerales bacterium]|nr:M28 family peptidase [Phycisphaerales bacterium]
MRSRVRRALWWGGLALVLGLIGGIAASCAIRMPGRSFAGPLPAMSAMQLSLADELRADVEMLAGAIGERNVFHPEKLAAAEAYLTAELARAGYTVKKQVFTVRGVACANIEAEIPAADGAGPDIVIIGAHYDAVRGCPAANDNGSGTAAVLALARRFAPRPGTQVGPARTIRFVFFVNEEPPFFWTDEMGSLVYARACKDRGEKIAAMLSIETIGYFSDERGSQDYPPVVGAFYPSQGDFIAFVGLYESRDLVERCVGAFRESAPFPSQGAALTALVPRVASSDHWSFWKMGYPALMVTDTAPYRYPHYHKPTDTPDKLNYERMARVVEGLEGVVREVANGKGQTGKEVGGT